MKPEILEVNPEHVPQFLKDHPHWVVWRRVKRGQKWTKPPFDPRTGKAAKVNDPATWSDFDTALKVYQGKHKWDGIGFMLTDALGLVGFDFDHCIDESGGVDARILEWVETLNTYTEVSPSGDGLRVLAFGELPEGKRKAGPWEVYGAERYLTITGHRLDGASDKIEHRRGGVLDVYGAIFDDGDRKPPADRSEDPRRKDHRPTLTDDQLLEKAFSSKHGDTIRALYGGQWEGAGYRSQSEADMALCRHLAFWFGKSEADIDRVFRSSGLMREKWDHPVKSGGPTYGAETIRKAVESTGAVYKGGPLGLNGSKETSTWEDAEDWEKRLSENHAVVMVGGKVLVLNETKDPTFGRPDFSLSTFDDFKKWYSNRRALNKKTGKICNVACHWLASEDRTQYQGIVFSPQKEIPGYYNLWKGFGVEPKPGDWSLLRRHIWECIVGENEKHFRWLIAWFARILQDPGGDRPGTAVVLKGRQGTGKGALVNQFQEILGPHFLAVSNQTHITGRFNSHHKNALMLFCDEGFWAGSKSDQGVLKQLITEPRIIVEAKNKDAMAIDNHLNLIIASNERWVVPADMGERRFFVLNVSDRHKEDRAYFKAIWDQMNNGGREAMAWDLIHNIDVKAVNLRRAPKTPALLEQIEHSMTPLQLWWFERLQDGENNPGASDVWEEQVECTVIRNDFEDFFIRLGRRGARPSPRQFGAQLRELCPGVERRKSTTYSYTGGGGVRPWVYRFPDLQKCRAAFEEYLCMPCPWD